MEALMPVGVVIAGMAAMNWISGYMFAGSNLSAFRAIYFGERVPEMSIEYVSTPVIGP
jgi:hypothetical protein